MNEFINKLNDIKNHYMKDIKPICIENLNELKMGYTGIYFLYDNDLIVYVGISNNIPYRVGQHFQQKEKKFNKITYYVTESYVEALKLECYYIDLLKPKYNKTKGTLSDSISKSIFFNYEHNIKKMKPRF